MIGSAKYSFCTTYSNKTHDFFIIRNKVIKMGNLLYWIAVLLVIVWAITYFGGYYTSGIIHALLVIAAIAVLLKIIRKSAD
jgi:predicted ferric reductase